MSNNAAAKRSRASNEQLSEMVDFMLANPGLAGGKFQKLYGKFESDKKWSELASNLNCLGGAVKTVEQWHTVWKDLKSRTSVKVRERKKQQALTGNKPINQEPITELEKRVVELIGSSYIEGHKSVLENVPLKEECQLLLEDGADYIFEPPLSPREEQLKCITPTSTTTPRRCAKRKRENDDGSRKQLFEIAAQQADALKMLAESGVETSKALKMLGECTAANLEATKMMADAIKGLAESFSATANAVHAFANAINKLQINTMKSLLKGRLSKNFTEIMSTDLCMNINLDGIHGKKRLKDFEKFFHALKDACSQDVEKDVRNALKIIKKRQIHAQCIKKKI